MTTPDFDPKPEGDERKRFILPGVIGLAVLVVAGGLYWRISSNPAASDRGPTPREFRSDSREARSYFLAFRAKVTRFATAVKDLRDAFVHANRGLIGPDEETDKELTAAIGTYNPVFQDLEANRADVDQLAAHLGERKDLEGRSRDIISQALDKVHRGGVLELNKIHEMMVDARQKRAAHTLTADDEKKRLAIAQEKLDGTVREINAQLEILERRLASLSMEILGSE